MIIDKRRQPALGALMALQAFCLAFLLYDVVLDVTGLEYTEGFGENQLLEYGVVFTLILSAVFTFLEMQRVRRRNVQVEAQLRAASGEFHRLLADSFEAWDLTNSERDVALLAIKGLAISEISAIRNTRAGTVKAQLNAIYRKAGVSGRPQLISVFVEELMAETPHGESAPSSDPA